MQNILESLDALIIENYKKFTRRSEKRPMDALAFAYALHLNHKKMSKTEIDDILNHICSLFDDWANLMEKSLAIEGPHCTTEWEIVSICKTIKLIEEFLPKEKIKRWKQWSIAYCDAQMIRPFYYTAYNHEMWRCNTLYITGETFNIPEYISRSVFFAKQLLHYVTDIGFWEEGPHHGPSMRYNYLMIHSTAYMARLTNDEELIAATKKLADFMAIYAYPDGSTAGPIDGRQSSGYSEFLYMTPGLEYSEKGQALFYRHAEEFNKSIKNNKHIGILESYFVIAGAIYFKRFNSLICKNNLLPLDSDNTIECHSNQHEVVMQRKNNWVTCISGHAGQIPKEAQNIFRLERQSRIELWHKDLKYIIGGGHNKMENKTPYTNVMIKSGFNNHDFDYGLITGTDKKSNHAMYFARASKTFLKNNNPNLDIHFSHGSFNFQIEVLNEKQTNIKWSANLDGATKIAIQLPVVVPTDCNLFVDQNKLEKVYGNQVKLVKGNTVSVHSNSKKLFSVKTNRAIGVRYPNMPLITYVEDDKLFFDKTQFLIAMISLQIENPKSVEEGVWNIVIE